MAMAVIIISVLVSPNGYGSHQDGLIQSLPLHQ